MQFLEIRAVCTGDKIAAIACGSNVTLAGDRQNGLLTSGPEKGLTLTRHTQEQLLFNINIHRLVMADQLRKGRLEGKNAIVTGAAG